MSVCFRLVTCASFCFLGALMIPWCCHDSLIAHEPEAMCGNVLFEEAGTYSNIYRLALSGNALHQSACTQILGRPCGVVQGWSEPVSREVT